MNNQIKEKLWRLSKHADEFPKDWIVIPTLDVIEIIENSQDCSGVELESAKEGSDICNNILPDTIQYDEESLKSETGIIMEDKIKIWICNDCGNELLEPYCIDCKSDNVEERE